MIKPLSKTLGKSFSRSDNKPLTLRDLDSVINQMNGDPAIERSLFDKPVVMSSDEEGNDMLHLWSVEVSKTGEVTLRPATYLLKGIT